MKQNVCIIGGTFRGKKIYFPDIEGLRPTPSRVRETLFNWLMFDIRGARCLDAFTGSGALGFEALSRGACHVTMLDTSPLVIKALRQYTDAFDASALCIEQVDACEYLKKINEPFDIIFLDPPFASAAMTTCITLIEKNKLLKPEGLLYLESPEEITLNPKGWSLKKSKKAGQVFYALYTRIGEHT